jgi:ribosome-binding protein aMBF1 (putative translation factor)
MSNDNILNKLNALASDESSEWLKKAKWREENRDWLDKSAKIAVRILREIRAQKETKGMSQKMLAEMLHVSPQYINKIIKGQENLSLETINKIEKALGITLVNIPEVEMIKSDTVVKFKSHLSHKKTG